MSALTTLQLAERIATAVLEHAYDSGNGFMWEHAHESAVAVLDVLHKTDHWFCRVTDADPAHDVRLPEVTQQDLFGSQPDREEAACPQPS